MRFTYGTQDDYFYYDEIFESFIYDSYYLGSGDVFTKNNDNYEMHKYRKYYGFWKLSGWLKYKRDTIKIDCINKNQLDTIEDVFNKKMIKRINLEL